MVAALITSYNISYSSTIYDRVIRAGTKARETTAVDDKKQATQTPISHKHTRDQLHTPSFAYTTLQHDKPGTSGGPDSGGY